MELTLTAETEHNKNVSVEGHNEQLLKSLKLQRPVVIIGTLQRGIPFSSALASIIDAIPLQICRSLLAIEKLGQERDDS